MTIETPARLLTEELRADAPLREASVARVLGGLCAVGILFILGISQIPGAQPAIITARGTTVVVGYLTAFVAYYGVLLLIFRGGIYHPWVAWLNVLVEVSFPLPFLIALAQRLGREVALGGAVNMVWAALIMLSALRTNPKLSFIAGVVAAAENFAFYLLLIRPAMPEPTNAAFTGGQMALRSFFLVAAGVGASTIARHLVRKATQALQAVRSRDLMGKYIIHERIGAGGMAEVMRATYCPEGGFEKAVAVKRILPAYNDDPKFVSMFARGARLCATLQHPNVVQVFDVGRFAGTYFLAMEHVDGLPLHVLLRAQDEPLPLAVATYIGAEIAAALDYIHSLTAPDGSPLGLVHRDLNPPNILISRHGEVKLSDFGIAQASIHAATTRGEVISGKLQYLAPEQLDGRKLDGRTDLFALGATMYEIITGERLLKGRYYLVIREAMKEPFAPPSAARPEVPAELDAIVAQLLSIDPSHRPGRGHDVRRELESLNGRTAPYPEGRILLAQAVADAQKRLAEEDPTVDLEPAGLLAPALIAP